MQLTVPAFPKLAVVLSMLGVLGGLAASFAVTPRYVSTARMTYDATSANNHPDLREYFTEAQTEILSRTSLSSIIQDPRLDLYPNERRNTPLEDVIEKMRREDMQISATTPGGAAQNYLSFRIRFAYRDRIKAQQTVQAVMRRFSDGNLTRARTLASVERRRSYDQVDRMEARIAELERRLGMPSAPPEPPEQFVAAYAGVNLDALDPPSLPVTAEYPDRFRFMSVGFGAGLAAAFAIAIFRRRLPPIPFPAQTA